MNFDTQSLIVAFPPSEMANLQAYRVLYGSEIDGVQTLLCHLDNADKCTYRPGQMPTTVTARKLTDGRYAVAGYWSLPIKEAWEQGDIQAEILTPEQLQSLTPEPEL